MRNQQRPLAEVLRQAIRGSGSSVNALAKRVGIPQPSLHHFLHGHQALSMANADKLLWHFRLKIGRVEIPGHPD